MLSSQPKTVLKRVSMRIKICERTHAFLFIILYVRIQIYKNGVNRKRCSNASRCESKYVKELTHFCLSFCMFEFRFTRMASSTFMFQIRLHWIKVPNFLRSRDTYWWHVHFVSWASKECNDHNWRCSLFWWMLVLIPRFAQKLNCRNKGTALHNWIHEVSHCSHWLVLFQ